MPFFHATEKFLTLNLTKMYCFVWTCLTVVILTRCWWSEGRSFDGYEHLHSTVCCAK